MNATKARELFEQLKTTVMNTKSADNLAQAIRELITDSDGTVCYHLLRVGQIEFQRIQEEARTNAHDMVTYVDCDRWIHPLVLS